ncbi:hypothetical protein [Streptomyces marispadix]|uniref:Uncharacterized protein n=1 Tax=Streptomyces marispadix TaxID=2922868 RepID=A0ABS9T2B3_9ACTN|nr:hypothetical protein [Streptomyces marispadix]MCH6162654.1 hypothetical protein [Streptomyces marispadix]
MRFHGSRGRETFSGAERTNLPEPVEPGTDYHDVRVDYRLATALRPDELPEPEQGPDDARRDDARSKEPKKGRS